MQIFISIQRGITNNINQLLLSVLIIINKLTTRRRTLMILLPAPKKVIRNFSNYLLINSLVFMLILYSVHVIMYLSLNFFWETAMKPIYNFEHLN